MTTIVNGTTGVTFSDGSVQNTAAIGFRNRIINGNMMIDQRNAGAAFTLASGTNSYGSCDRWASIASAASWTLQQVATGNYDFPYAIRIKRTAAATASTCYIGQVIETINCQDLAGQPATLSFYVTAGANYSGGTFTVEIWTGTGTNQGWTSLGAGTWTGQTQASANTPVPTTTRTKYSYTATLGSTVAEVAVRFTYAATGTAGANDYVDVTGVQLEKATTASSFDFRSFPQELALCQRYYEKTYDQSVVPGTANDKGAFFTVRIDSIGGGGTAYKVTKRATPTVTFYSPTTGTSGQARNYTTSADTAASAQSIGDAGFYVLAGSATNGAGLGVQWTAAAEL